MKIALVISCVNSKSLGNGGHYYSFLETAYQLNKNNDILVISIGNRIPKAFKDIEYDLHHLHYNFNILKPISGLNKIIEKESVDIIHAFDEIAYLWVRFVSKRMNLPSCVTKCGGRNPIYYPISNDIILFSKENEAYFKSLKKFSGSRVSVLPNRIRQFSSDFRRINAINDLLKDKKEVFKFLRIVRIGNYYHNSSVQLINLIKKLNNDGVDCCAIFVGIIEDSKYLKELKELSNDNIFFITDNEFTADAKRIIDVSDCVMGTGRSFMEASAKSKILLTPNYNNDIPALITKDNFYEAFFYNFSERIEFKDFDKVENYSNLKEIITNKTKQIQLEKFSLTLFEDYFDSDKIAFKLIEIYKNAKAAKTSYYDMLLHLAYVFRKSIN